MINRNQKEVCEYKTAKVSQVEWDLFWQKVPTTNLLQSWQYGTAKEEAEGWSAHRVVISDNLGLPVAIAQCLTRTWPIVGGIARINRGPLLLKQFSEEEGLRLTLEIIRVLILEMRKKRCWMLQLAPELPHSDFIKIKLRQLGLNAVESIPWASGRINLAEEKTSLLMSFNGKWRNCMRKGEKLGVKVKKIIADGDNLNFLLESYRGLQQDRKFQGLAEPMIRHLAAQSNENWSFDLFLAFESDNTVGQAPIGHLVSIRHGNTATYLIGNANELGRQMQANSVLLWESIIQAQESGCIWYDIGGLNAGTPKGIAEFKKGLNSDPYCLAGEFRGYFLPW